jgi:hypothetical protein
MAGAAAKNSPACAPARLLFVVYGREATRINGNHEGLMKIVITWCTNNYEIYWQTPRTPEEFLDLTEQSASS